MKRRDVFIDPFAQQDLIHIYNVITELAGPEKSTCARVPRHERIAVAERSTGKSARGRPDHDNIPAARCRSGERSVIARGAELAQPGQRPAQ